MSGKAPFPIQPELTAIAMSVRNERMIADEVAPRFTIGRPSFKYFKRTLAEGFTVPDTKVGRKGRPGQVEFSGTEVTDSVNDYGLDDVVPQDDIDAAAPPFNPINDAIEGLTNLVMLDRERRVANAVFSSANYASGYSATLSGTSQWSDYTNSDPLATVLAAMDGMLVRPNVMVIGRSVFSKLTQHPALVSAYLGNSGAKGKVPRNVMADLFEVEEVIVGEGWINTARKGQAPTMTRLWGKHCSLLVRDRNPNRSGAMFFSATAQYGTKVAGQLGQPEIGLRGSTLVRSGESVKEFLPDNTMGYFFQNAVA